ncbi:hypothetical protein GGQ74_000091 [Desulfobaculum xiamenense]|uniref:Uncharacterized protein n=1 Tax=Desulfobaculum xiamenense TaxID=995050 RepID=A0A846QDR9_9BACT|nr:hypothetical protein [Desulfobaculum xiamenense]NJB66451.1 hypothetical protein [Desulfobaculum xiamenense]
MENDMIKVLSEWVRSLSAWKKMPKGIKCLLIPIGILGYIITSVLDKVSDKIVDNYWDGFVLTLQEIPQIFSDVLGTTYVVPLYGILLVALAAPTIWCVCRYLIKHWLDSRRKKPKTFRDYTEDKIYKVKWTWNWHPWENEIQDLTAYCPKCSGEIITIAEQVNGHAAYSLQCTHCKQKYQRFEIENQEYTDKNKAWRICKDSCKKEIERRIRAGKFT